MKLLNPYLEDHHHLKQQPGSYEWWYFDAEDDTGRYRFVIIYYDGVPFSPDYINAYTQNANSNRALAVKHPGISICVYDAEKPIYYSLSEFDSSDCSFSSTDIFIKIGDNECIARKENNSIVYDLKLNESLPCGNRIQANITFRSPLYDESVYNSEGEKHKGHNWYLIQPKAVVEGDVNITESGEEHGILFKGTGYHDHNCGFSPLIKAHEWYWGRFHFSKGTFICYITDVRDNEKIQGRWIDDVDGRASHLYMQTKQSDFAFNPFLLYSARRLSFCKPGDNKSTIDIYLTTSIDSGPYYQRFIAEAVAQLPGTSIIERASGIAEYIKPERIGNKLFWPFVNMRYRYVNKRPHPVQRSARLYKWTW